VLSAATLSDKSSKDLEIDIISLFNVVEILETSVFLM